MNHVERSPSCDSRPALPVTVDLRVVRGDHDQRSAPGPTAGQSPARRRSASRACIVFATFAASSTHRPPVVVGRERVVRIGDRDEIRDVDAGRLERRSRAPARGREEQRVRDLAVVEHDLTLRRSRRRRSWRRSRPRRRRRPGCACRRRDRTRALSRDSRARTSARRPPAPSAPRRGQFDGISAGTTPFRYASSPSGRPPRRRLPSPETTSLPR